MRKILDLIDLLDPIEASEIQFFEYYKNIYGSQQLIFHIIDTHFADLQPVTKILLHDEVTVPIRHYITEHKHIGAEKVYEYALKRITKGCLYLKEKGYM